MSIITDAILLPGLNSYSNRWLLVLDHISWQYDDSRSTSWKKVDLGELESRLAQFEGPHVVLAGGNKVFALDFWTGSFNHLPPSKLVERVRSAPWKYPRGWLLIVAYEHDDHEGPTVYWHDGSYPRQEPRECPVFWGPHSCSLGAGHMGVHECNGCGTQCSQFGQIGPPDEEGWIRGRVRYRHVGDTWGRWLGTVGAWREEGQ